MKRQISCAEAESHGKKRVTRRQRFLAEMESAAPRSRLIAAVEPYYPKGKRGRPPIGLERMLCIYFTGGIPSILRRTMSAGTLAQLFASIGRPERANFDWR
jgi:hypothetical protein